jgi:hypothetical protein
MKVGSTYRSAENLVAYDDLSYFVV